MLKTCIICRTPQTEFSAEHCFQKAIGGGYVIFNVCKVCNEDRLNPNIDTPFIKHIHIATYRYINDHTGYGRADVPDPLRGKFIVQDGQRYLASLTKDLNIESFLPPKYPNTKNIQIGEEFKLELDGSEKDNIQAHIKKLAKKLNISEEEIIIKEIKITDRPAGKYTFSSPNLPLIMGFAKILYEIAVNLIPSYFEDETSIRYAAMLHSGILDNSLRSELEPNEESIKFGKSIHDSLAQYNNEHLVFITGYPGVGLVGIIKVYGISHAMILSRSKEYWEKEWLLVSNDYKDKKFGIYKLLNNKILNSKFEVRPGSMSNSQKLNEEFGSTALMEDFALHDSSGKKIYNLHLEIINSSWQRVIHSDFKTHFKLFFPIEGKLFVKSKKLDTLIPIDSITINMEIEYTKIR